MYGSVIRGYRLAVVVPAHNEELHITRCIKSLLAASRSQVDVGIVVIADNCTDETAKMARAAGARVLVRTDPTERGKGYALDFCLPRS